MILSIRSKRARALLAAPAIAIALSACGGADNEVATTSAAEPASAEASQPAAAPPTETGVDSAPADTAAPADTTAPADDGAIVAAPAPATSPIEVLTADQAIANAETNIANLAPGQEGDSVLDVEVLAVGDGSILSLIHI